MIDKINNCITYAHGQQKHFLDTLSEFLSIPSISADPDYQPEIQRAATWLAAHLESLNIQDVKIIPTDLNPVVYGSYNCQDPSAPTILVYGHYDVQPVDPLDLWNSQPFTPIVNNDHLFARGASDMKGQIMASLNAIEVLMAHDLLNVNLRFLFEGEEEIGSPNIHSFLVKYKDLYPCDIALNLDAGMLSSNNPTITYGLRGISFFEILITGPEHDLHSGSYGGVVENPAHVLSRLIAGMHDENGKITLPGYYEDVRPLSQMERKELARLPMQDDTYVEQTGVPALWGEKEFTATERIGARPSLDVNGFESGYNGVGQKTIIPSWAKVKISSRLVPDQDPEKVHSQLKDYLAKNVPATVHWELKYLSGSKASISDPNHSITKLLIEALETTWNQKVYQNRLGASIPIVGMMQEILGIDSILSGFCLPEDNIHAPNERLSLSTWYRGIDAIIKFLYLAGKK